MSAGNASPVVAAGLAQEAEAAEISAPMRARSTSPSCAGVAKACPEDTKIGGAAVARAPLLPDCKLQAVRRSSCCISPERPWRHSERRSRRSQQETPPAVASVLGQLRKLRRRGYCCGVGTPEADSRQARRVPRLGAAPPRAAPSRAEDPGPQPTPAAQPALEQPLPQPPAQLLPQPLPEQPPAQPLARPLGQPAFASVPGILRRCRSASPCAYGGVLARRVSFLLQSTDTENVDVDEGSKVAGGAPPHPQGNGATTPDDARVGDDTDARCDGVASIYVCGQAVDIYSRSLRSWVQAEVTSVLPDGSISVLYGHLALQKTLSPEAQLSEVRAQA